jgi:hypothetical protein
MRRRCVVVARSGKQTSTAACARLLACSGVIKHGSGVIKHGSGVIKHGIFCQGGDCFPQLTWACLRPTGVWCFKGSSWRCSFQGLCCVVSLCTDWFVLGVQQQLMALACQEKGKLASLSLCWWLWCCYGCSICQSGVGTVCRRPLLFEDAAVASGQAGLAMLSAQLLTGTCSC